MKKVSVVLIDWKVRESFHAVEYLNRQTVPRAEYEVLWVEYYDHRPQRLKEYWKNGYIDNWIVLSKEGFYFKHLLFNEGIVASTGEIVVICDSDALFSPTFIENIIKTFEQHKNEKIALYLDEIRNNNKCFYPFKNVSWDEAMSVPGLINWNSKVKKPYGLTTSHDIIHHRNYGACFCAKRKDIIEMGGFDEHASYHCFFCGPYELGWRMVNNNFKEIWHSSEWLLHVWHPWVREGVDILGESDGRGVNSTAIELRKTGRVLPLLENEKVKRLRAGDSQSGDSEELKEYYDFFKEKFDGIPWRRNASQFFSYIKYLLMPTRVKRVLVLTEYDPENTVYKSILYTGVAGKVSVFNYDQVYHSAGYEFMFEALIKRCKTFNPDLIIFIPPKKDIYLSPEEKVVPGDEVFDVIKKGMGVKVFVFDRVKHSCLAVNPLNFWDHQCNRDIDVCFWGSVPSGSEREDYIKYLKGKGIRVLTRDYRVSVEKYSEILNRSKIVLNIGLGEKQKGILCSRTIEALLSNCLLLEDEHMGTDGVFKPGVDYESFSHKEDLLKKIIYFLDNFAQRQDIALSGHLKAKGCMVVRSSWLSVLSRLGFERDQSPITKLAGTVMAIMKKLVSIFIRKYIIAMLPMGLTVKLKLLAKRLNLRLAE